MVKERSVSEIHSNCTDDGGCLIWCGKTTYNGLPIAGNRSLRRVVWQQVHGRVLQPHQLVTTICGNVDCLEPEHFALTTKSKAGKKANEPAHVRLRRSRTVAATVRDRATINMDVARAIRASEATCEALGALHGISVSMVSKIRCNKAWRETSSPFQGLGAR